ncbi:MAG TPA: hypothetical protein VIM49_10425, partial [Dermatophilaceae bacterium]
MPPRHNHRITGDFAGALAVGGFDGVVDVDVAALVGSKRPVSRSWKYLITIFAARSSAARSGDVEAVAEVGGEDTDVVG